MTQVAQSTPRTLAFPVEMLRFLRERAHEEIAAMARVYHRDRPGKADDLIEREFRRQRRVSFVLMPADVHIEIGD